MKHKMLKKLAAVLLAAVLLIQPFSTVAYAAENPFGAIPDPTYGYPVKELALQDGTVTYHIKDTVNTGDGVTFAMGLALEVAIGSGSGSGTGFQATSSKSTDVNVSPKGELSANFNGLSPTAMLDAPGGWIYPRICNVKPRDTALRQAGI